MFDMMKMMGKVKELQDKMKEAQEKLVTITATGESGGGMVKATVNGKKQVVSIDVDPDLVNGNDKEMMQDLVVAAINVALADVDVLAKEESPVHSPFDLGDDLGLPLVEIEGQPPQAPSSDISNRQGEHTSRRGDAGNSPSAAAAIRGISLDGIPQSPSMTGKTNR